MFRAGRLDCDKGVFAASGSAAHACALVGPPKNQRPCRDLVRQHQQLAAVMFWAGRPDCDEGVFAASGSAAHAGALAGPPKVSDGHAGTL